MTSLGLFINSGAEEWPAFRSSSWLAGNGVQLGTYVVPGQDFLSKPRPGCVFRGRLHSPGGASSPALCPQAGWWRSYGFNGGAVTGT